MLGEVHRDWSAIGRSLVHIFLALNKVTFINWVYMHPYMAVEEVDLLMFMQLEKLIMTLIQYEVDSTS